MRVQLTALVLVLASAHHAGSQPLCGDTHNLFLNLCGPSTSDTLTNFQGGGLRVVSG